MNLYDIALLFKAQLLDKLYIVTTQNQEIHIRTFPRNLLHLTGLQRTKEFKTIKNPVSFYDDCINKKYLKETIYYTYNTHQDRNIVDMKISVFDKIQDTILNAPILYHTKDSKGNISKAVSVSFAIKNKNKYVTIVFKPDKITSFYVPVSIQLDQNLLRGVASKSYNQENITNVQMLDCSSEKAKNIIKEINKQPIC